MKIVLAAALAVLATPAMAQDNSDKITIDVGKAPWGKFPRLASRVDHTDYAALSLLVEDTLSTRKCRFPGQQARHFDITVPYAVKIEADGSFSRILVSDIGCRQIEQLVGYTVFMRSRNGEFAPVNDNQARWYSGELNINLE
ncbi:MAG: hypothetical protein KF730_05235 [Sphingomonas sp.]|uniref:hypothetical protein n=1 Tax=Sphingomonas sp. TaxID=28214 RepID=UPI0025E7C8A9|nr:hypothetical protein [Sphingomonas sp.]MBX3563966.1 hypothetical protein [Sphingomonas sp.]